MKVVWWGMAMSHDGLVKLSEEAAEVIQVAQKLIAYPELAFGGTHPDGVTSREKLELEIGDLRAAILFVKHKLSLNEEAIFHQANKKLGLFLQWDKEP
jgi:NTP pyrophosphatase (non-canonical NTP hydrolase)